MAISLENLSNNEHNYLSSVLKYNNKLELEDIWALIDTAWEECKCDPKEIDERISIFYKHPVWLLNGMFIEQHNESLRHRQYFADYVISLNPRRIADYGGGYGSLARMIGARCPDTEIHIVEPHPHSAAVSLAEKTTSVRYMPEFLGEYDVLIATDVFEHVPDPLALIESTATHLRMGGEYLIANCFCPVIRCHLPSTFHFRYSWDAAMAAMNLKPGKHVAYGRAYKRIGPVSAITARGIEHRSRSWFEIIERIPKRFRMVLARLIFSEWR